MVLLYDGVMIKVLEDVFISTHVLTLIKCSLVLQARGHV